MDIIARLRKALRRRKGSSTIEYVTVIAAGLALALILNSVMSDGSIKTALSNKVKEAITGESSETVDEKKEQEPGFIAKTGSAISNGWNRITGIFTDEEKQKPNIQKTQAVQEAGLGGLGGPGAGAAAGKGFVGGGGRSGGKAGSGGSAKSGGNVKESPSFFERFTGWMDNKWNGLIKRFKGGGGSTGGRKPSNNGKGKKPFKSPELKINGKQFGKKSGKHAQDYGLDPKVPENRQWIKNHIKNIHNSPNEVRQGSWRGIGKKLPDGNRGPGDALYYRKGNDVVVTDMEGNFITILKDGAIMNTRFRNAIKVFGD